MRFDPVSILSMAIALLLGLTIHEFSHAWAANRLGDPTPRWAGRVTLNPLAHLDPIGAVMFVLMILGYAPIAWGKPVPINPAYMRGGRRGAALATAAGPASNLVLALGVAVLWRLIHVFTGAQLSYGTGARTLLLSLMGVNVALAAFNLIPLPPLDGFGILEGIAPYP
ncbi:MAG: site-2 protease family protein, partial [Chloroflexia bacterium]